MQKLLILLSLFTVSWAQAADSDSSAWYTAAVHTCSSGEEFQKDIAEDKITTRYKISEKLDLLTMEFTTGGQTITEEYALKLMGKNAYIASPKFETVENKHFFVSTGDIPVRIVISTTDVGGAHCNGGLVLTTVSK